MAWIEPVTDRTAGSRTTYEDMNRICGNLEYKGFVLTKNNYISSDIVTKENWDEIVDFAKRGDVTVTDSTHYVNLNKLEAAIALIEPGVPLTFTALENTSISFTKNSSITYTIELEYSVDNGATWQNYTFGNAISLSSGQTCMFKGDNERFGNSNISRRVQFNSTGRINASGSIVSLIDSTVTTKTVPDYAFQGLFYGCSKLVTAPELTATILGVSCYSNMFYGCTNLTTAPLLPATTLSKSCYYSMFYGCINLVDAPALPATTLAENCYQYMFDSCSLLATAPSLPATILAANCYYNMFNGCRSLITAPSLPATTLAESCYQYMFAECWNLTAAPELPATTLAASCYRNMFSGCRAIVTVPKLPAITLADGCYTGMFYDCIALNVYTTSGTGHNKLWRIPQSGTGTAESNSLTNMFRGTTGGLTDGTINTTYYTQNTPV